MTQKPSTNETQAQLTESVAVTSVGSENSAFESLSASLTEIRKLKGVIGYILRSNGSAIIDLNEQDKIMEYAVLSSQVHESSQEMAKQFNLGEKETVLVEGKDIKMLCMTQGENRISVFMGRSANHAWIIKRILL